MNYPTNGTDSDAIIAAAREVGALQVRIDPPFRWASGAMMPVYNDNRRLMADPGGRTAVRRGLANLVARHGVVADAVAGTASAGIAPATLLAEELELPLYYVRSSTKEHGRRRLIEGAPEDLAGQRIILVEDLISTGGSSVAAAEALIAAGAEVVACLAIFSYGFAAAEERFGNLPGSPPVYPLATVSQLIDVLTRGGDETGVSGGGSGVSADADAGCGAGSSGGGRLTAEEAALLRDWMEDPFGWYERSGGESVEDAGGYGGAPRTPERAVPAESGARGSAVPAAPPASYRSPTAAETASGVREFLSKSAGETLLCVGLDPRPEFVPGGSTADFLRSVIDEIAGSGVAPAAFKPNVAYFHQLDRPLEGSFPGSDALAAVIHHVRDVFPGVPLILDAKRGDIAGTSAAYAREAFSGWDADAVTVSPFMGDDSVAPFLEAAATDGAAGEAGAARSGRAADAVTAADVAGAPVAGESGGADTVTRPRWVYLLNRTSNPGARRFQEVRCGTPPQPLYVTVAEAIREWQQTYGTAGAVIGATAPAELRELLAFYRATPIPVLIPGVGSQGGSAAEVLKAIRETGYPPELIRVNVSRRVVFPWAGDGTTTAPGDWRRMVRDTYRRAAEELTWV
jgi:orotidine-5'-phosphate decarboxylase